MKIQIKKPLTIKDLKKVVSEVAERIGGCDEYDKSDLMDILGEFGEDQFIRGVKFQKQNSKLIQNFKTLLKNLLKNKNTHSTHSCPDNGENFECRCYNKKINDQNFWCIYKKDWEELLNNLEGMQ